MVISQGYGPFGPYLPRKEAGTIAPLSRVEKLTALDRAIEICDAILTRANQPPDLFRYQPWRPGPAPEWKTMPKWHGNGWQPGVNTNGQDKWCPTLFFFFAGVRPHFRLLQTVELLLAGDDHDAAELRRFRQMNVWKPRDHFRTILIRVERERDAFGNELPNGNEFLYCFDWTPTDLAKRRYAKYIQSVRSMLVKVRERLLFPLRRKPPVKAKAGRAAHRPKLDTANKAEQLLTKLFRQEIEKGNREPRASLRNRLLRTEVCDVIEQEVWMNDPGYTRAKRKDHENRLYDTLRHRDFWTSLVRYRPEKRKNSNR